MNVLIASVMLLSAIQVDAAQLSNKRATVTFPPSLPGDGDGGAGPLDLINPIQAAADEKAEESEMRQRTIEDHLHEVEEKRYVLAAKLKGIDKIVNSDDEHHHFLTKKGLSTDERNAKGFLHDADLTVQGKIELDTEKRARFALEQKKLLERNEWNDATVIKKQEQVKVITQKYGEQKTERGKLFKLKEKESVLASGVAQEQGTRLKEINEKLGLDKIQVKGLTGTLTLDASQETQLTSQLAKIVHNDDDLKNIRSKLSSKTEQLAKMEVKMFDAQLSAATAKKDCAEIAVKLAEQKAMPRAGAFLEKAALSSEVKEQISKQKMDGEKEFQKELADQEMHGQAAGKQ